MWASTGALDSRGALREFLSDSFVSEIEVESLVKNKRNGGFKTGHWHDGCGWSDGPGVKSQPHRCEGWA